MSAVANSLACPVCRTELTLAQLLTSADDMRAFARLAAISIPLGARVMQYITLFAPPKTRLTPAKQLRLIEQLLPDLERQAITHKGRDWSAPMDAWAAAIDQMLDARNAGRLDLPMSGHGYLYAILAGLADKHEAQAEQQREQERRNAPRQDTVQVRGQAMGIGDALKTVYGGRDPALVKLEADRQQAAPIPTEVRERLEQLKGRA